MSRSSIGVVCGRVAAVVSSLFLLHATGSGAVLSTCTLNSDGAWCWFQDERAVMMKDKLAVASISSTGTVQVNSYDLKTGAHLHVSLHKDFMADDHNVPGMLKMDDGRLLALYCRHSRDRTMHCRTTVAADSIAHWSEEAVFGFGVQSVRDNFTYSNPFQLADENGRVYLFWRAIGFCPTFSYSDDRGASWADAQQLISFKGRNRPYVKYCTDHREAIHITYTEAHPNVFNTSIYHIVYRRGHLYRSDGTVIGELRNAPIAAADGTRVYSSETAGKGWIWDAALDTQGAPVLVYATLAEESDHRYRYARWNSDEKSWEEREIARAGGALYGKEKEYSGGICIDPDNTSVVYMSTSVDPVSSVPTSRREIYRGVTADQGVTWEWTAITTDSPEENLRPIVPEKHPGTVFVLWLRGRYTTYTDYHTSVVLASDIALP